MKQRKAFTMIELIFVIVVLGILAMVAIPRMSGAIEDANIGKAKSDVSALRSAIASERQARFLQGNSGYISDLDQGVAANTEDVNIFDDNDSDTTNGKLLTYPIVTGNGDGEWMKTGDNQYKFTSDGVFTTFTYTPADGRFTCTTGADASGTLCSRIIN